MTPNGARILADARRRDRQIESGRSHWFNQYPPTHLIIITTPRSN